MKWIVLLSIVAAQLFPVVACAGSSPLTPKVGDTYEIVMLRETKQEGSNGSSSSSHDKDTILERVISIRSDGLELQYDLPKSTTADGSTSSWQFPARIFKPFGGPAELLNGPELEARVDRWLKSAGWPRTACGQWIFTWTAFRIECDPKSVINLINAFDLGSADLREGAPYQEPGARGVGKLAKKGETSEGFIFLVELPIDADLVRRSRAETDVAVGEIMKKPVSFDAALQEKAKDTISGKILITFETDSAGNARRRTKMTTLNTQSLDGGSETEIITETIERRLISRNR